MEKILWTISKKNLDIEYVSPRRSLSGAISNHILIWFILWIAPAVKTGIESVEVSGIKVILNDAQRFAKVPDLSNCFQNQCLSGFEAFFIAEIF